MWVCRPLKCVYSIIIIERVDCLFYCVNQIMIISMSTKSILSFINYNFTKTSKYKYLFRKNERKRKSCIWPVVDAL